MSHKKRKRNDKSAVNQAAEQDYNYSPIRLQSVQTDLEAIPRDILIRALVHYSKNNIQFFGGFNDSLEKVVQPEAANNVMQAIDVFVEDHTPSEYEQRQYSPLKVREHVIHLFDQFPYFKPEERRYHDSDDKETDKREINYNTLMKRLEVLLEKALALADAGENASAYIILQALKDTATLGAFESNGDIFREDSECEDYTRLRMQDEDDEDELDIDMSPDHFVDDLNDEIQHLEEKMSDPELNYCNVILAQYEAEKPSNIRNQQVFDLFPGNLNAQNQPKYGTDFIGIFSSIRIRNNQPVFEVHARAKISLGKYRRQKITFNSQQVTEYQCTCPVFNAERSCDHITDLVTYICSQKTKPQVYNNMQYNQHAHNHHNAPYQ